MSLTQEQARASIKSLNTEMMSLTPSILVTLCEIDITQVINDQGFVYPDGSQVFRFHNLIKLNGTSIFWQGNEYIAAPITLRGYETNGRGTNPTPELSISVTPDGIPALAALKSKLLAIGDLAGAKVTRIRTFSKYLDAKNFTNDTAPPGFSPDSNSEFLREVFYIDRKTGENKTSISFELASITDYQGLKLPRRVVFEGRCNFDYRGEGCMYEYEIRRNESIHGSSSESTLLSAAPPVATENDERIADIISPATIKSPNPYNPNTNYVPGDSVFLEKDGIKYYYVNRIAIQNVPPPNSIYWLADKCSKCLVGCRLRYGSTGTLPFGGFPAVNKIGS